MGNLLCAMQPATSGWWEEWVVTCPICEKEIKQREWREGEPPLDKGERVHFQKKVCYAHECS